MYKIFRKKLFRVKFIFLLCCAAIQFLPAFGVSDPSILDITFNPSGLGGQPGTNSTTIDNLTVSISIGYSVAIQQADGKIVVAGNVTYGSAKRFAISRFNNDGTIDETFNAAGLQKGTNSTKIRADEYLSEGNSVAIQADGKIVVAGYVYYLDPELGDMRAFAVARFNQDGTLDTLGFNPGGLNSCLFGTNLIKLGVNSVAYAVAIQKDSQKIILVGHAIEIAVDFGFAVAQFDTNGILDTSFNGGLGTNITRILASGFDDVAYSVAIQDDKKIVLAGSTTFKVGSSLESMFAVARFKEDGVLDTLDFNPAPPVGGCLPGTNATKIDLLEKNSYAFSVAIQKDQKIVIAGYFTLTDNTNKIAVARFGANGLLDTSFNPSGVGGQPGTNSTSIYATKSAYGQSVAIQDNQNIVISGRTQSPIGGIKLAVARFDKDGILDTTGFNPTAQGGTLPGTVAIKIDPLELNSRAHSVAIQTDQKIVASGSVRLTVDISKFAVARFGKKDHPIPPGPPPVPPIKVTNACALKLIEKYGPRIVQFFPPIQVTNACALKLIEKYGPRVTVTAIT